METIATIIVSVVGALVVQILFATFAKLRSFYLLKLFSGSDFWGHGIEFVYENQIKALPDIEKDIENSDEIKIFSMRGGIYIDQDGALSSIINKNKQIKFLLSSPSNPYISERAEEVGMETENYRNFLTETFKLLLHKTRTNRNIERHIHSMAPIFRLLILNNRVYFSFFKHGVKGPGLKVFRAKANSIIYKGFSRYYEHMWKLSFNMD